MESGTADSRSSVGETASSVTVYVSASEGGAIPIAGVATPTPDGTRCRVAGFLCHAVLLRVAPLRRCTHVPLATPVLPPAFAPKLQRSQCVASRLDARSAPAASPSPPVSLPIPA